MNIKRTRPVMGVRLVFSSFIRRIFVRRLTLMSIQSIRVVLNAAIQTAARSIGGKDFSRKSALTAETVIRLLIGAEGGSLAKILHDAGIQATASALSQRRAQIPPAVFRAVFDQSNSTCTDSELFRGYRLLAVDGTTVNLPRNPNRPPSFRMTVFQTA
ncbi:hypothetical protein [Pseudoflavonifractor sp. MSJ-37]|uniref:hypothetical protein n=1 Tax=Pseudoflavonifractor sp. MSJ-37 TaxID=2841531 RepID=UPI001C111777|nr:hypothetical protein [Pseudoflavonifractor sp. MSJ-37]MBU5435606.1 hypothetical protein [Pseudoflavonifractor sp. MSJ-37]